MRNNGQPIRLTIVSLLIIITSSVYGQGLNPNWNSDLKNSLQQFLTCQRTQDEQACAKYLGESLQTVYKIKDFYSPKLGRYMKAGEIATYLKETKQWTKAGHAYEQNVLKLAQDQANSKKAVVAVYMNQEGIGHVVVITPGELQRSGSWGLDVPNAASFFLTQPDKSFVDKSLAFAFGKTMLKDIVIYTRNY